MEPEGSLPHSQVATTCPFPETDHSMPPHPTAWRSILMLSSHLCLGLPSGLCPSGFPTTTLYTPFLSPIHTACPTHLTLLDLLTWTILGEQYRSLSSSLYNFFHFPLTSPLLSQVFSSAAYSQTLSAYIPPSMWVTKFPPIQNNRQNYGSDILNCIFLASKLEDKRFCTKW